MKLLATIATKRSIHNRPASGSSSGNIGKAKLIKINIAKLLGDKVAVTSGLEGITNVITIGAMYLEDGENIKY